MLRKIFTILIVCSAGAAMAQPENLGQLELNVTEKYKASVGEAVKLQEQPDFKDTTTSKLQVNYRIVSQPVEVKYKPEPISPARIAQIPVEELQNGLVRLGFGLYVTPLAEVYWNSGRSSSENYGFWGSHFSTVGGVEETVFDNNGLSNNEIGGYYNRFFRKIRWETKLRASWDKYSYYGIDPGPGTDSLFAGEDDEPEPEHNWYRMYELNSSLTGDNAKDLGWVDRLGLRYYNFSDAWNSRENYFKLSSNWEVPAEDLMLDVDLNASYFQTSFDSILTGNQSYFTLQLRPHLDMNLNGLLFTFGFNVFANSYMADSLDNSFNPYFFPEIKVRYALVENVLSAYAGVEGQFQQNTYSELSARNPYMTPGVFIEPTRTTDVFVGLQGVLSANTSFNLKGGFKNQKDLVLWYRDPFYRFDSLGIPPSLGIIYDNAETFYARGEVSVNFNEMFQAGAFGELRSYSTKTQAEAWHIPNFIAGVDVNYIYRDKLKIGADLRYTGAREAFVQEINPDIDSKLPGYVNASLDFEYLYNSRLSAFVNVRNLLNQPYDLYLGYKAQKINFLMGFSYKF